MKTLRAFDLQSMLISLIVLLVFEVPTLIVSFIYEDTVGYTLTILFLLLCIGTELLIFFITYRTVQIDREGITIVRNEEKIKYNIENAQFKFNGSDFMFFLKPFTIEISIHEDEKNIKLMIPCKNSKVFEEISAITRK